MTQTSAQKICLITGAAGGLGAAIAKALLADGFKVALSDSNNKAVQSVAAAIDPEGKNTLAVKLDVLNQEDFTGALSKVIDRWGAIDGLVNNAAITKTTPIFEITPEEFDDVVRINLRSVFLGCQVFGRHFADKGYGRIVNMASLAAQNGGAATGAHYAASKGGIVTLTKVFARDLAASGVTVNAISPGPLDVPLVHDLLPVEKLKQVVKSIPVGQLGDPGFIGRLAGMLLSKEAASVTGATYDANGGLYVR